MASAGDVVHRFRAAVGAQDFAAARKLLHDSLSFQGPLETFHKADDYVAALQKLSAIVKGVDVKKHFVDGNDVCVLYDLITNTPAGTSFVSEWLHVEGDKIAAIRVVFDARPFAAMFET
jgi:limonene-1,2-epoxide hydrolase